MIGKLKKNDENIYFLTKQTTLMRRSIALALPLQSVRYKCLSIFCPFITAVKSFITLALGHCQGRQIFHFAWASSESNVIKLFTAVIYGFT